MAGSQKKVIIRLTDGSIVRGYLPAKGFLDGDTVQVLDVAGTSKPLTMINVRAIHYVRDFNFGVPVDPEEVGRTQFLARPRGEGLWLRITFPAGDTLEGLAASDLHFAQEIADHRGVFFAPPDARANTQHVFVPCSAISRLELLGVISPAGRRKQPEKAHTERQGGLFEE